MQIIQTNLNTKASTQFTNFDFNSMCMFKGVVLGAGPEGLFKACCGDTDDGMPIEARIDTGQLDVGINNSKRLRFFYFGVDTSGYLKLSAFADGELAFTAAVEGKSGLQNIRIPVPRTAQPRYWQFRIENEDGAFFALYSIKALPVVLHPGSK